MSVKEAFKREAEKIVYETGDIVELQSYKDDIGYFVKLPTQWGELTSIRIVMDGNSVPIINYYILNEWRPLAAIKCKVKRVENQQEE